MAAALALGWRHQGLALPNPSVGCILVRPGAEPVVVGRGVTEAGGRPHGEAIALREAGEAARGATAYVSLEPCAHHGRAGPCCEALAAAGVARVVTAMEDPDPRVAGRGHAFLAGRGVAVTVGVLESEARAAHAGHVSRVLRHRPHVLLKLAVSADGHIGRRGGGQVAISGPESRDYAHVLRAESDAILVGVGTALADDPMLTCRLPGMEQRTPLRVVLDGSARLPPSSRLARSAQSYPVIAFVGREAPAERIEALRAAFVDVRYAETRSGRLDLADVLAQLSTIGIGRLMVEGGATIARRLVEADLVDEFHLVRGTVTVGTGGVPALAGLDLDAVVDTYAVADERRLGRDRLVCYRRKRFSVREAEREPASARTSPADPATALLRRLTQGNPRLMFTGIVTDVGEVLAVEARESGLRLRIACSYDPDAIDLGASIACSGPCLTVVAKGKGNRNWFDVEASVETIARTTLGDWKPGRRLNLERALKLGDELGGHMVTGHVDGVCEVVAIANEGDMRALTLRAPADLAPFIAAKGSVALDGTSLTVNSVSGDTFTLFLIPHTLAVTTWGELAVGDRINIEIDMMARYLARLVQAGGIPGLPAG